MLPVELLLWPFLFSSIRFKIFWPESSDRCKSIYIYYAKTMFTENAGMARWFMPHMVRFRSQTDTFQYVQWFFVIWIQALKHFSPCWGSVRSCVGEVYYLIQPTSLLPKKKKNNIYMENFGAFLWAYPWLVVTLALLSTFSSWCFDDMKFCSVAYN